ncbi:MAG: long-chain fatty acid--CoA ligase [Actinobacteria bacterium]|nr:long-chain fatty acid--CoA ligase [Actinomycetota bacterium]
MNLARILEAHPDDAVALISRNRRTTYGELRSQIARMRGGLVGLGIEPGDRVGIICANNWYFVLSYLGILGAGAVAVPLNPLSPARELERELAAVGTRAVILGPAGRQAFAAVERSRVPTLEAVVVSGADDIVGSTPLDAVLAGEPAPVVEREDGDLAVLIFTSGTAGSPKAAMLSHGNLRSNIEQVLASTGFEHRPDDVSLGVLPMFHIYGLNAVLGVALARGGTILLIERFDPQSAAEAIGRQGVTIIAGAPTMWAAWASMPDLPPGTFATVRMAASGAARLAPEVAARVHERFGLDLAEGYGLTEASPVVTSSAGISPHKVGSIGVPLPGVEVRLVDADGEDVLIGDEGEIWVRGPNVFGGYWNDRRATAAALTPDGWLRTGDIAVVDDDGYVFLVDRAKDLIIVSGFNVYPAEVEEVLVDHPGIEQAAVVGVSHPYSGEAVKAYVVAAPGASIEEDDVIAFAAQHLARYKCPEKVMFVDEIPHGLAGKVLRRALR